MADELDAKCLLVEAEIDPFASGHRPIGFKTLIVISAEDRGGCDTADVSQVSARKIQTASAHGACLDMWISPKGAVKSKLHRIPMRREGSACMGCGLNTRV